MQQSLSQGAVIAGRYRIDHVLGEGGMGVVVAATDLQLERRVALKFMLSAIAQSADARARFLREARASVRLTSENVARVHDVGQTDDGSPYMVMELLEGSDLHALREKEGVLRVEDAVDYVLQACDAVAEAHSLGIVHRDLKPQNLFLTRRSKGRVVIKVLDFGISKVIDTGMDLTRTHSMLGSPLYMAPEQLRSARTVDLRTDIWALGVILYELVTGRPPFMGETLPELTLVISQDPPAPPRSVRAEIPVALDQVILRCLEKSPAARFQNVGELMSALGSFSTKLPAARSSAADVSGPLPVRRVGGETEVSGPASAVIGETARSSPALAHGEPPAMTSTDASWGNTRASERAAAKERATRGAVVAVAGLASLVVLGGGGLLAFRAWNASERVPSGAVASAPLAETAAPLMTIAAAAPDAQTVASPPAQPVASAGPVVDASVGMQGMSVAPVPPATGYRDEPPPVPSALPAPSPAPSPRATQPGPPRPAAPPRPTSPAASASARPADTAAPVDPLKKNW